MTTVRHPEDSRRTGKTQRSATCLDPVRQLLRRCVTRSSGLVLLLVAFGCQSNSQQVVLEDRLRDHESTIRELRSELAENKKLLSDQDRELAAARQKSGKSGRDGIIQAGKVSTVSQTTEQQVAWGSVSSLELHRLTSGLSKSAEDGVRQLNLVLQPLDGDGELVKVAGELTVHASAIGADGGTQDLIHRDYSITESRRMWTRGLVSSGFHVSLPLPPGESEVASNAESVLVTASLKLSSERIYQISELLPVE